MGETLGARLRQRRESQQVTLATIANQTKIKLSLLEALEQDDFSQWPGGLFRRAFVRAYAQAIGADPEVVVREFLALHPDPADGAATESADAQTDERAGRTGPPTRLRYLLDSALGSLLRARDEVATPGSAVVADSDAIDSGPASAPAAFVPDILVAARLCTELGRVGHPGAVVPLLAEVAAMLDAVGLIVWLWDAQTAELKPALTHGYADSILAQLPTVGRDADNATAAAFRAAQLCVVNGSKEACGALVVPLMAPAGCLGVLAIEFRPGSEQTAFVRALVTMFAAQLARCAGGERPVEAPTRKLA